MIGIERYVVGDPVQVKRHEPDGRGGTAPRWSTEGSFSHYARDGRPVVTIAGKSEIFPDGTWIRRKPQ